ncbi:MAG: UbiA family prenyltransferase [Candidatus Eisenbacteria bacterium]|nr:UbiA family prenyltransferase [Candidatus Eisenbacteria bacterium]
MGGRSAPGSASASDARALVRLARPANGLIAACAVVVGAVVSRRPPDLAPALVAALSAFAATAGANALNDVLDRAADAVNRPGRPIPSGAVGVRPAVALAFAGYAAALGLALALSAWAGALAAAWVVLTALYSVELKRVPLASNALVAAVAASPLLMGGISQGRAGPTVVPLGLAFLAHLAREIAKDVEDVEGDAATGVRTIAVALGSKRAMGLSRIVMVALMGAAVVPFAARTFGWGYAAALVVIDALLVLALVRTAGRADREAAGRASLLLKCVMALGLLAFVLGVVW